jgi:hypothetical protein
VNRYENSWLTRRLPLLSCCHAAHTQLSPTACFQGVQHPMHAVSVLTSTHVQSTPYVCILVLWGFLSPRSQLRMDSDVCGGFDGLNKSPTARFHCFEFQLINFNKTTKQIQAVTPARPPQLSPACHDTQSALYSSCTGRPTKWQIERTVTHLKHLRTVPFRHA